MKGSRWKTRGGSFGFLNNSCLRTLTRMTKVTNAANAEERSCQSGSTSVRRSTEVENHPRSPMIIRNYQRWKANSWGGMWKRQFDFIFQQKKLRAPASAREKIAKLSGTEVGRFPSPHSATGLRRTTRLIGLASHQKFWTIPCVTEWLLFNIRNSVPVSLNDLKCVLADNFCCSLGKRNIKTF